MSGEKKRKGGVDVGEGERKRGKVVGKNSKRLCSN